MIMGVGECCSFPLKQREMGKGGNGGSELSQNGSTDKRIWKGVKMAANFALSQIVSAAQIQL